MEIFAAIATFIIGLAGGFGIGYSIGKENSKTNQYGMKSNSRLKL